MKLNILEAILSYPITILYIITLFCISFKLLINNYDINKYSFNIQKCLINKQWWRIITSTICHNSYLHLFIDILTLWNIKKVEKLYGIFYFIRYSFFFIFFNKFVITYVYGYLQTRWRSDQITPTNVVGVSSLIFSWLGFLVASLPDDKSIIYLYGFFPLAVGYIPIIIILAYQIVIPRSFDNIDSVVGLIFGIFLGIGWLEVLPNFYWTTCFFLNVLVLVGKSWYETMTISGNHYNNTLNSIQIISREPVVNQQIIINQQQSTLGLGSGTNLENV